jgi:hypothetical protein
MSSDIKLNELHYHELLDRLHAMMMQMDSTLLQHPVTDTEPIVKHNIQSAISQLWNAYQIIGNEAYKRFEE